MTDFDSSLHLHIQDAFITGDEKNKILEIPSLKIPWQSKVGILGPSGAGKSTFLNLLSGLLLPDAGHVRWGETDIVKLTENKRDAFRRENIGLVFQDTMLFEELSAQENACVSTSFFPRKQRDTIKKRAKKLLERLNVPLTGRSSVESMSGGERQRIAVARALATDPKIIIADEPTAALDRESADRLVDDLIKLAEEGKTLIVVSHDQQLLDRMDRRIQIKDGIIQQDKSSGRG